MALSCAVAPGKAAAQTTFTVTTSGFADYFVDGVGDPPLFLVRGQTYQFNVTAPGHPFFIKTAPTTGTGDQFTTGVTNNGLTSGTLAFVVPQSAPSLLFYQCSVHSPMSGRINVVGGSPVPGTSPESIGLLVLLLFLAGAWGVRQRLGRSGQRPPAQAA